jgi:hypothetical protein
MIVFLVSILSSLRAVVSKKMKLIGIILVLSVPFAASVVIDCRFGMGYITPYQCSLISDPSITERDTVVTAANGDHEDSMNHASVTAFLSHSSTNTINYIPRGLNDLFPNLIYIAMQSIHLKEIRQADLQWYTELTNLHLGFNDIEIIEPDLFKYNPQLQTIDLSDNKIKQVDPNVFDHLNQLNNLYMGKNKCVNRNAYGRAEVLALITKIKSQCNEADG